jgi:hypothetical protein
MIIPINPSAHVIYSDIESERIKKLIEHYRYIHATFGDEQPNKVEEMLGHIGMTPETIKTLMPIIEDYDVVYETVKIERK